jgi:flagellar protein FlgJ
MSLIKPELSASVIINSAKKNTFSKTDEKDLKQACMEFEALLINQMLSTMRKSTPKEGLIEKSFGEDTFREMLDQEYAKEFAKNDNRGLGKILFDQLTKTSFDSQRSKKVPGEEVSI